jgi:hypothetical protein
MVRARQLQLLRRLRIKFLGALLRSPGTNLAATNQTRAHSPSPLTSALSTQSTQPTQAMLSIVTQTEAQHLVMATSSSSATTQTPLIQAMLVLIAVQHTQTPLKQLMGRVRCWMVRRTS